MSKELNLQLWTQEGEELSGVARQAFNIVDTFLNSKSTDEESVAVESLKAAQRLHLLTPARRPREGGEPIESIESFLLEFWEVIINIAEQIPVDHPAQDSLVELVRALSNLEDEVVVKVWNLELILWYDLPLLGAAITEALNQLSPEASTRTRWANFETFLARLTRHYICDRSYDGILTLRNVLEQATDSAGTNRISTIRISQLNAQVPVVAKWITLVGSQWYATLAAEVVPKTPLTAITPGRSGKGGPGLSFERWSLWKSRLGEIAALDQINDESRKAALETIKAMEEIEEEDALEN